MKTHKGLKKRLRVTRKGKVMRSRSGRSHLMSGTSARKKRHLRRKDTVQKTVAKTYRRLLQA
jgi:large subunit ribosomal protein L35